MTIDLNHGSGARIGDDGPETAARARLNRAAPDLLNALVLALPYVETAQQDPAYKRGAVARVVKKMRAALAKAEG